MALFQIQKGKASTLATKRPNTTEGYCYFTTDDGKFYIDIATATGTTNRVVLNAYKADIFRTARNLQVDLESTSYVSFDGSVDRKNIGISGVLGVANGGTGKSTHTANAVLTGNGTSAVKNVATASGALYATSANGAPVFGTLPVAQGGTGLTTNPSMLINLASNSAASVLAASPRPGVTGTLAVGNGGTGKTSWTANALIYAATTTSLGQIDLGTSGYVLQSNGSTNAPSWINATNSNTASTIVKRDASGNFNAGTITATLSGTASRAKYLETWKSDKSSTYGASYPLYGYWQTNTVCRLLVDDYTVVVDTADTFSSAATVTLTGDVTGTASSTKGWSVATTLANSGVTAGSYGPSANATPAHGGTFSVPYITFDAKGRATAASTKTITLPTYTIGNATITIAAGTGLTTGGSFTTNQTSAGTITLNHSNSITAGSVGSAQSPSHGGTFAIPKITYDAQGHITAATTVNITLPADNNTHYTANLLLGASGATATSTTAVSNPYIILRENGTNRNQIQVKAGSNVTVSGDDGIITISSSYTNTTYSQATSSTLGLVKIGYTASGKNYPVQLNTSGQMYVNVPWTDNNTTYTFTNKAATLSWGTTTTIATVGGTNITVALPANPNSNTAHAHAAGNGITLTGSGGTSGTTTIALSNSFTVSGTITAGKVVGAVWNDYAEYRWVLKHLDTDEPIQAGRCVAENGNDSMSLTNARLQAGVRIVSDTYGMCMGETEKAKTPVAVCGRVLAYPFERKVAFNVGDPVCSGPNGTVSKMSREEAMMYPERIVGTVVSKPTYKEWGPNKIPVNGRIWIQVR